MSRSILYFHKKIPAHFCTRIFKSFLLETNPLLPLSFASFQVGERVPHCFHLLYTYTSVFRKLLSRVGRILPLPTPSARRLLHWPPVRFDNPVYELLFKLYWKTSYSGSVLTATASCCRRIPAFRWGYSTPWYLFSLTSKGMR